MQIKVLASGSKGNAIFFELGGTRLLIDAGISARRIEKSLGLFGVKASELDAILVTHEHTDHVNGIDVLARRHCLPVFARPGVWDCLNFKDNLAPECRREIYDSFDIGPVKIEAFQISHDAADPVGFCLSHQGSKHVVATDLGKATKKVIDALAWADTVVLEANHDVDMLANGSYPFFLKKRIRSSVGHLSNLDAARILGSISRRPSMQVFLAHLSQENNHPDLAEKTVREFLLNQGCDVGHEVILHPTYQNQISGYSE
ncbi:MAG: MBL fold metallo-hydrolase [Syntrophomonadaceae bacterium]|nr:MBL fold metallo-hydrolase [Syntrophomonadaceae bacterium]